MVLFTSNKSLERAENIRAVFEAYPGDKTFYQTKPGCNVPTSGYNLRVCDEFIGASPGKAIMIGHGIAGGKTYGLDQPHPYHSRSNARLLTYVVTTSPHMVDIVAKQSGVPADRVLPLGMPRTDVYFKPHKMPDKRIYLYAPTFRNRDELPMPPINFDQLDRILTDDELMIVKPHTVTRTILRGRKYKHIIEAPAEAPSAEYLMDCSVLITDYSSIMLDAHVAGKPVVLYDPIGSYPTIRGMYLPYPGGYASRFSRSEESLVYLCRNADEPQEADIICRDLTASACDGHSTERVVKLIEDINRSSDV